MLRPFRPLKMSTAQGFAQVRISKFQIEYFYVFSPAFLSNEFSSNFLEESTDENRYGELSEWSKVQHSKCALALAVFSAENP